MTSGGRPVTRPLAAHPRARKKGTTMEVKQDALAPVNLGALRVFDTLRKKFEDGIPTLRRQLYDIDPMDDGAELAAGDLAARAKKAINAAEDLRKREQAPVLAAVDTVRSWWRPITEGLTDVQRKALGKATEALKHKRAREEEERKRAEKVLEEARAREVEAGKARFLGSDQGAVDAHKAALDNLRGARVAVEALSPEGAPTGIKTPHGTLTPKVDWLFEVVDAAAVPREWLCPDVAKIAAAVAPENGVREIPGVRIWPEEALAQRVKR